MNRTIPVLLLITVFGLSACSDDDSSTSQGDMSGDTGAMDLGFDLSSPEDMSSDEGGSIDMGGLNDAGPDFSEPDMTLPPIPFGEISGLCGELDAAELNVSMPFFFKNEILFSAEFMESTDLGRLTDGGQEIIADGNAGGSSLYSEVFAFEVLERCEMATLLKTETEIVYDTQGKITDLLVELEALKIGVSVTRAVTFPRDTPYSVDAAQTLLEKKLADILLSSANVAAEDEWEKQILYVLADTAEHAVSLEAAWMQIDPSITADTIVYVTVSEGTDDFIY